MPEGRSPLILTAELAREDQNWAEGLRRTYYPSDRNRVSAHITLFHHLPPSLENELRALLARIGTGPAPAAGIEALRSFGSGVAIDIRSPALLLIRAEIAERFEHQLIPQDRHTPRLHITIQNKVDPATASATLVELRMTGPRSTRIAALTCWHYLDGPWQLIARYPFRG